jgi:hypothetical protein
MGQQRQGLYGVNEGDRIVAGWLRQVSLQVRGRENRPRELQQDYKLLLAVLNWAEHAGDGHGVRQRR